MKNNIFKIILILTLSTSVFASDINIEEAYTKLKEHQTILNDYENHSQYYGRGGLDIESHTKANIRYYQEIIDKHNQTRSFLTTKE